MSPSTPESVDQFLKALQLQGAAELTLRHYRFDLVHFAHWFESALGEAFSSAAITPTDIRDYRSHLLNIERRKPATIQRRLAALSKFGAWSVTQGLVAENPALGVKGVAAVLHAPKSLEKREVERPIHAYERAGNKRDLAILATLRHPGLRVSELAALRTDDIQLSERKGQLVVRSGKGAKQRVVPLNLDARKALQAYLDTRRELDSPYLVLGQRDRGLTSQGGKKSSRSAPTRRDCRR
jgi:site-specific recombinase XerD